MQPALGTDQRHVRKIENKLKNLFLFLIKKKFSDIILSLNIFAHKVSEARTRSSDRMHFECLSPRESFKATMASVKVNGEVGETEVVLKMKLIAK